MKCFIYIIILSLTFLGCQKDSGFQNSGKIIGGDRRMCMCCGGWFIEIEKDTFRFDRLPEGSTLKLTDAIYPVDVWLDWQKKDPKCLGDEIIVTRIKLKE